MSEENWWRHTWWILAVFALVTIVFVAVAQLSFLPAFHGRLEPNGYGDSFGLPNAAFSALAFAGVIVTLILQMIELKAQRREMIEMQRVQLLQERYRYLDGLVKQGSVTPLENAEHHYLAGFIKRHCEIYSMENDAATFQESCHEMGQMFFPLGQQLIKFRAAILTPNELKVDERDSYIEEMSIACETARYSALQFANVHRRNNSYRVFFIEIHQFCYEIQTAAQTASLLFLPLSLMLPGRRNARRLLEAPEVADAINQIGFALFKVDPAQQSTIDKVCEQIHKADLSTKEDTEPHE